MRKVPLLLIFIVLCFNGIGQKRFVNTERASQLKAKYDDADIVAFSSTSDYTFEVEKNNLVIYQQDEVDLISLRSNMKYFKNVFYNDNVDLLKGDVKYTTTSGSPDSKEIFGNYEVDGFFYTDAKIGHYSFDLLYEGTEVTFKAEKKYKDPRYLTKVFFQDTEPTHKRVVTFSVPDGVEMELVEVNFEGNEITKSTRDEEGKTIYVYTCTHLKTLVSEENSLGYLHYAPHLVVVAKGYKAGAGQKRVIAGVEDLYNWYIGLVNQVEVDASVVSGLVKDLISDAADEKEKIRNIYYWVQENIKYIAFEEGIAGFMPDSPQKVYANRYGDCKGIAYLTKTMLREAGFDARLTWIGTNTIPYNYDLPSLAVDNHMICTVFLDDDFYVLDATEKYIELGDHAERIQGKEMLIENGDAFIRRMVPVEKSQKNLIARSEEISIVEDNMVGKGKLTVNGEAKKSILYFSTNSKVEDQNNLFDYLSVNEYNNDDEVKVKNIPLPDRDLPLEIDYDYSLGNHVTGFGDELFVALDWDKPMANASIEDDRLSDYYFGRKVMNKVNKKLEIPEGYKLSHLPNSIKNEIDDISVDLFFKEEGNYIVYSNEIIIESGKIKKENFEAWNEVVSKINEVYNDQIIFTKL